MAFIKPTGSILRSHPINSKNNNAKKFNSAISGLLKTLNEFAISLNDKAIKNMPLSELDKVCFILINTYENENENFGIGPLNDAIHICLHYRRLHYRVFYLYNPRSSQFISFLEYFLKNTINNLTVFYSGYDSSNKNIHDIKFPNGHLPSKDIKKSIMQNCNGKAKITFITNSFNGGSVFDITSINNSNNQQTKNDIISFWVEKDQSNHNSKKSHGTFIYYLCKFINGSNNFSPKDLVDKINPSLSRFSEVFQCEISNEELADSQILFN